MQVSAYMERLRGEDTEPCKKASRCCKEEETSGDNIKDHGHNLLENYPEGGLKRGGFCTKVYLHKMAMIQVHGGSQHDYSVACSNEMSKESMTSRNISLGHIADS